MTLKGEEIVDCLGTFTYEECHGGDYLRFLLASPIQLDC